MRPNDKVNAKIAKTTPYYGKKEDPEAKKPEKPTRPKTEGRVLIYGMRRAAFF